VTLITGASKGIGRALVEHYLNRGHAVVGCSRSSSDLGGEEYLDVRCDVGDEKAVARLLDAVRRKHGRIDNLINNAGIARMNHFLLTPQSTVAALLETNVIGAFVVAREAARLMQRGDGGSIVNLSSIAVPLKLEGEAAYVASKAAVVGLTEVLARELAPMNITVNAVGPGPVQTDLIAGVPAEKMEPLLQRQAIPRHCEFSDVANAIDFFVSSSSRMVTGQTLYLGGV
jgi:3-oxoacyl-[acyl-carrier protein] reductase